MSIALQEYIDNISDARVKMLTSSFEMLTYLFGDWLTYNELINYKDSDFIDIAIGTKLYDNNILMITIWFDNKYIKDIEIKNYGNDLIYKLEQIDEELVNEIKTKSE